MSVTTFDYIIVGAGAAGSVLANRLSENGSATVLILEAGGSDRHFWVRVPLGVGKLLSKPDYLWRARTEPESGLQGNQIDWPSGRMWGGSSSVNGMLVVRGNPAKYDEWARSAGPTWAFKDLLPYFKRLEACSFGDPAYRGKTGPIGVTEAELGPLGSAFIESCEAAGYPRATDYNGGVPEGAGPFQLSTRHGIRSSTAVGYLRPAKNRRNLEIVSHAVANKIIMEQGRAVGVQYVVGQEVRMARARREVLLSAGAIRSPQLLELSGIGRGEVLQAHGIPVVRELRGVGENLQDHFMVRICYECTKPITIYDFLKSPSRIAQEFARYALFRKGLFATSSFPAIAFLRSDAAEPIPDIRIQLGLTSGARRLSTNDDSGLDPHSGFHLGGYRIYPESRGSLHIKSLNAADSPRIVANYLTHPQDQIVAVRVLKILRRIASQTSFSPFIVRQVRPNPLANDDVELLDYSQRTGDTCWHPCGTCQMGNGPNAVVDSNLRVHGVAGLRIVDTSVFPFLVASNTNIPTIMLAERAADLIGDGRKSGV